jgi:hypothetical protein
MPSRASSEGRNQRDFVQPRRLWRAVASSTWNAITPSTRSRSGESCTPARSIGVAQ